MLLLVAHDFYQQQTAAALPLLLLQLLRLSL
jgi:hypothetical protein